jgi:F0F1-type ATP synthase membrane subunit b/b'
MAKTKADSIVEKAENDANSKLEEASREIEKERLDMLNGMKSKVNSLVLGLNAKLFKNDSANKDFLEKEVDAIKL